MPNDHLLLSLSPERATQQKSWHPRGASYDDAYIESIPDPTDATPKRLLTAVPSPYARIHLFDTAFHFVANRSKQTVDHSGTSVFHRAVSDCFDVLELLFSWSSHSHALNLVPWDPKQGIAKLRGSGIKGQALLAKVLELFLTEDGQTAHFDQQNLFYLLLVNNRVIALSSPLTLFITSPNAAQVAKDAKFLNPETGDIYFSEVRPLHLRQLDFQQYIHWLFYTNRRLLTTCCRHMYDYLSQSLVLLAARDEESSKLAAAINGWGANGAADLSGRTQDLHDNQGGVVTVLGATLCERSQGWKINELKTSPMGISSSRVPLGTQNHPLVLDQHIDSLGQPDGRVVIEDVSNVRLDRRILPDCGVNYPYLVAGDFLEDRIIRLPFRMNTDLYASPIYRDFDPKDEWSYLPPLKNTFFDYFNGSDISTMCRLTRKGGKEDEDSVLFELEVPVRGGRKVKFSKTYNISPQLPKNGKVVRAKMSCAVYPNLVVSNYPEFNDRYWVMLVDDEREHSVRNQECFGLQFYRVNERQFVDRIGEDTRAGVHFKLTKRNDKEEQSGSSYYEVKGGYFDFAVVEAFQSDVNRAARGVIVPKWRGGGRPLGTKSASVAIDFGTTNTHVAWTFSDGAPDPKVLSVAQADLQLAALSAPIQDASSESTRYNSFPSELAGFEIRLQHEFVPAIIGGTSPFRFPLRTATSERRGLEPGAYHMLGNANISFTLGVVCHRLDEVISTDLKWSVRASEIIRKRVETYIGELLHLIRTKMILNDVDPRLVQIVWFRPLSFDGYTKTTFEGIWSEAVNSVFKESQIPNRVLCLTESEAPYYYHSKAAKIATEKPVLCIDIGGGSTDIVVFDRENPQVGSQVPKIGTSFSFAGNALWGDGFDEMHTEQSGLVRKYKNWVKGAIPHINDQTTMRNMDAVFKELESSRNGSEEYLNFFFSIDSEIGFTKQLMLDGWVKCLVLIHYSAIVFHCAQLMKTLEMQAPQYICLSGRGAQSVKILDGSEDKKLVTMLTRAIFEEVYGAKLETPITLRVASKFKEATCNGGVLKGMGTNVEPDPVVLVGDGSVARDGKQKTYAQIETDGKTLNGVLANMSEFADTLVRLNGSLNFRRQFGIDVDFGLVSAALKQNVREYINLGLQRRGYAERPTDSVNETLFFYPLIQNLFELGKNVAGSSPL
jgi:hypothetical protein